MRLISIDPSINTTGVCVWERINGSHRPRRTHCLKTTRKDIIGRLLQLQTLLVDAVRELVLGFEYVVIIEIPNTWTRRGRNVDSLEKLAYAIGTLIGTIGIYAQTIDVCLVPVSEWKGRKKKLDSKMLAIHEYGLPNNLTDHEYDAVGLGHWYLSRHRWDKLEKDYPGADTGTP